MNGLFLAATGRLGLETDVLGLCVGVVTERQTDRQVSFEKGTGAFGLSNKISKVRFIIKS